MGIDLGEQTVSDNGIKWQEKSVPYELADSTTIDPDQLIIENNSFANPDIGILVNNFKFHHRNDVWTAPFPLGNYNPSLLSFVHVGCGFTYEVPKNENLVFTVIIHNLHNNIFYSCKDNFGIQSAHSLQ